MAEGITFVCNNCAASIESWSDGNPYYLDAGGAKAYAYHPDQHLLERCIGNDAPHLCLACGEQFMVDSEAPVHECPKCKSQHIAETFTLEGKTCPFCQLGVFESNGFMIS